MKAEQIAQRLFLTVRNQVARNDVTTQQAVYELLIDELEREMGRLEEENASDVDEDYDDPCPSDPTGEGD